MNAKKLVFTNGCFDILHVGHVKLLEYCSTLGDVVVGLNSDASVKRLKGANRPVNNQDSRKTVLESLRFVSQVLIFDEDTPYNLISVLKPDLIVKGGDYNPSEVVGSDIAVVLIFPTRDGFSTSGIIEKMRS
jgi:D-beta-D-heptose 7-phosphate kinase/D-beta-D-heptose 1-phosphate adenosyltransferase